LKIDVFPAFGLPATATRKEVVAADGDMGCAPIERT
jgi:hypothetical protein